MPLSQKDQQLWQAVVKDVQPLDNKHLPMESSRYPVRKRDPDHISHTVDLHGLTLPDAHDRIHQHLMQGCQNYKYVTIITGKSGQLSQDVPRWIEHLPGVRKVDQADHKGSVKVWFKTTRQTTK